MANTYTLISSVTVGSGGASSIAFSSIPSTYTDLVIKFSSRTTTSYYWSGMLPTFNGSTSSFTYKRLYANQTTASSDSSAAFGLNDGANAGASIFSNNDIYIPNYTSSNYKSFSIDAAQEINSTNNLLMMIAGLWSNTAAITSITLTPDDSSTIVQYSTAYLYGISNA